jgi:phosphohistidine phosphatase
MTRELLILRHAKSAWDTGAPSDFERPLAKRGRKAAPRVGRYLASRGLVPDYVVASPALRAKQTVIAVCAEMKIYEESIHWDERIYGGWTTTLIDVLRDSPDTAGRVMIAGHNPGLESLVESLSNGPVEIPADGKLMPTAAVAHLEISCDWRRLDRGAGRLLSLTRARSLT